MKATKLLLIIAAIIIAGIILVNLASALTITSVSSNPTEVQPGEKVSLDLTIRNNLDDDVENVIISLILNDPKNPVPFAPYQSSNEARFSTLDSDDEKDASFDLIAFSNAASGTYLIPVQIDYTLTDNGTKGEDTGLVSIIVNAKPKIGVSSESTLIKGQAGKITIKVVNSGLGNAQFLTINLLQTSGLQLTSPASVYIGNIDSNDFDSADFNVFVSQTASSSISSPVQVAYTDSRNNQLTENENLIIRSYSIKEAQSLGLKSSNSGIFIIIIFIIIAIILYLVYRSVRKRLKKRKLEQEV